VVGLPAGDPDRDDRLHGDRDDLEHGRGGQGRDEDDPGRDRPRADRRVRHLLHAAGDRAVRPAGRARGERRVLHAAGPAGGGGRLRGRPDPRGGQGDRPRPDAGRDRAVRRPARRDDPLHRDERRAHRRLAARLLDGRLPPAARPPAPAAPQVRHAVDRADRVRRGRVPDPHPRPGRLPRADVRLRRDALVLDRPPVGDPAAPDPARSRAPVPRPGQHPDIRAWTSRAP
jgi:hypothetical protein